MCFRMFSEGMCQCVFACTHRHTHTPATEGWKKVDCRKNQIVTGEKAGRRSL